MNYQLLLLIFASNFGPFYTREEKYEDPLRSIPKRVGLIGLKEYGREVLQEFVYTIEDYGLPNLEMSNFEYTIRKYFFGVNATGNVSFTEGFIDTIQTFNLIKELQWDLNSSAEIVSMSSKIRMEELAIFYNYIANLESKNISGTVGITLPYVDYDINIYKSFQPTITYKGEISYSGSGSESEWMYYPFSKEMELVRKDMRPNYPGAGKHGFTDDLSKIGKMTFKDLLEQSIRKVNERLPFPELCFDCTVRYG